MLVIIVSSGVLFADQQLLNLTSNVNGHSNIQSLDGCLCQERQ